MSATDVVWPAAGEVIDVVAGEVVLFAVAADGLRTALATVSVGDLAVGCAATDEGLRMLAVGLPGSAVALSRVDDHLVGGEARRLEHWLVRLGDVGSAGRWPNRLVEVTERSERFAPGEHLVGSGRDVEWVRLTSGSASWCSHIGASIGALEGPVALTRTTWLTARMRCHVVKSDPPASGAAWIDALDLAGRRALVAAQDERSRQDGSRVGALVGSRTRNAATMGRAVGLLTTALDGRAPALPDDDESTIALAIGLGLVVARASGLDVPDDAAQRIRDEMTSGRDRHSAIAAACGARCRNVDLVDDWWRAEGPPLLGHLHSGEPIGLVWRRRAWHIVESDGDGGRRVDASTAAEVAAVAVEFVPVLPPRPASVGDLVRVAIRGSRRELAMVAALTLPIAALSFAIPYVFGQLAGDIVEGGRPRLGLALMCLVVVVLAGVAWQAVRQYALLRARARAVDVAGGGTWDRMMRLPVGWHRDHPLGTRIRNVFSVNTASTMVPDAALIGLLDATAIAGSLAAVGTASPALVVGLAVLLGAQALTGLWLVRAGARRAAESAAASAVATGRLVELLRAINRLRVAGAESRAFLRWATSHARVARAELHVRRLNSAQTVLLSLWPVINLAVTVGIVAAVDASFADLVTVQSAAALASAAVASAVVAANVSAGAREELRAMSPTLEGVPEGSGSGAAPGVIQGGIAVHDLVYRHPGSESPVIDGVSLQVHPGEHVAIVGPSGCGKTTLMRLMLGLDDPESGVVTFDGKDLAGLDRPSVRRQIGCVLQSSALLPGTIRENVAMGRHVTGPEIWAALDAAALGDDVRQMPMGLETPCGDGAGTLSGGQRQRVLIARAMVGGPRILVLDEATSALDNLSQAAVVESLERLRLTRVVVAHRLSPIRHADRIVVLSAGKVVQTGTFDELVAADGAFRDLAMRQLV